MFVSWVKTHTPLLYSLLFSIKLTLKEVKFLTKSLFTFFCFCFSALIAISVLNFFPDLQVKEFVVKL